MLYAFRTVASAKQNRLVASNYLGEFKATVAGGKVTLEPTLDFNKYARLNGYFGEFRKELEQGRNVRGCLCVCRWVGVVPLKSGRRAAFFFLLVL